MNLVIFDLDDTLFRTTAQIAVVRGGVVVERLTSQEYNTYQAKDGDEFDFTDFCNAQKFYDTSVPIPMMAGIARSWTLLPEWEGIYLTAREDMDNPTLFLETFRKHDLPALRVERAGNYHIGSQGGKKIILESYLKHNKYKNVVMFDDCQKNLNMFLSLQTRFSKTTLMAFLVGKDGSPTPYIPLDL